MTRDELIKVLAGFEEHYDKMDLDAWNKGDKKRENYACCMDLICRKLKRKLKKIFAEHPRRRKVTLQEVEEVLFMMRDGYSERIKSTRNEERIQYWTGLRSACEAVAGRVRTVFRNASTSLRSDRTGPVSDGTEHASKT